MELKYFFNLIRSLPNDVQIERLENDIILALTGMNANQEVCLFGLLLRSMIVRTWLCFIFVLS